ncbi:Glucan-binding domain-containing protein (YG repeat) [Granulicatella balaenopterae]|uniref:Glucan-binding domain-containing protein (YG repeat) n=1 Tax=Granulicatella balaenopterae TaxID=137733 RepID=A0A1H9MKY2_9LACT|nr:N-acetylmuramoyl-L-alanine amidase family protein [Granulicatella balaenopterae]SER24370.1 Glucan-binding domain-containing protein (YG repeat) [Granulicatella balaenopterae]
MKKRVLSSVVALSLVAFPSVSVLANTTPSEQDVIKAEKNLIQAEENLKIAKEKDATAKEKLNDGAFAFFADLGDEGKECLEILTECKYHDRIQRGVKGWATSTENILKSFKRMHMANFLRTSYELKGHDNAELKVTSKMMAMAMADADYSANIIGHAGQFPVAEILAWGYYDPFDGWYWEEKANYFLNEGKEFTPEMNAFFEKYPGKKKLVDANGQTGHYFNVVDEDYKITGYAICSKKGCEVQDFINFTHEKVYSVDEYETLFTNWYQELENSKDVLIAAQEKTARLKKEYQDLLKKYYGAHMTKIGDKYVMHDIKGDIVKNVWGEKDGQLYYASNDGYLITNRIEKVDNVYRGFDHTGAMIIGWGQIDSDTYYFDKDGILVKNAWKGSYYLKDNGQMAKNQWIYDKDYENWFYINEDGTYAHDTWKGSYYLTKWGEMAKDGWAKSPTTGWHYFNPDGTYVQKKWVGAYYLKQWGYMAQNEWIWDKDYNNWFFIKEDGSYARNTWKGSYFLKQWGEMAKNEWIHDGKGWYYMTSDGTYARNTWKGSYYLKQWGEMAQNEWIHDGKGWYYMTSDGTYDHNEYVKGYYIGVNGYWK